MVRRQRFGLEAPWVELLIQIRLLDMGWLLPAKKCQKYLKLVEPPSIRWDSYYQQYQKMWDSS